MAENNRVLLDFESKKKFASKVSKLKTLFDDLDKGKIPRDSFPDKVEKETGFKWNQQASKYLNHPSTKESNFTNLLKSLDVLNKKKTQMPMHPEKSYHPIINYNRVIDRKKVVLPVASKESEFISDKIKLLLAKQISAKEFKEELNKNNVDLKADPIKRKLKMVAEGKEVQYKDLMATITRFKNDKNKIEGFESKIDEIKPMVAHNISDSHLTYTKTNKKLLTKPTPTNKSNNELYDWEQNNYHSALKYEEQRDKILKSKPSSQIFNGEIKNDNAKTIQRRNPNENENGNIIKWQKNNKNTLLNIKQVEVDLQNDKKNNRSLSKNFNKNFDMLKKGVKSVVKKEVGIKEGGSVSGNGNGYKEGKGEGSFGTPCMKRNKSIFGYKNSSSINLSISTVKNNKNKGVQEKSRGNEKGGKGGLIRPVSTKNLKLHMSSSDNFLASLK